MRAAINESLIDNMPADRDESRIYASVSAYLSLKHPSVKYIRNWVFWSCKITSTKVKDHLMKIKRF